MIKTKLIEILRTFSPEEFREFEKMVSSPFFSKGRNLVPYFKYLKKYYPEFNNENLRKEKTFAALYPGKKYSVQILKVLNSSMLRMCEEYFFQVALRGDMYEYSRLLSAEFSGRRFYDISENIISAAQKKLRDDGLDAYTFYRLGELEKNKLVNFYYKKKKDCQVKCITDIASYHAVYSIIEMLQHLIRLSVIEDLYNADTSRHILRKVYDNINIDCISAQIKERFPAEADYIEFYKFLVKLSIDPMDEDSFLNAARLFSVNIKKLSAYGRYNLFYHFYRVIDNLRCIDDEKFTNELFGVFKEMLKWRAWGQLDNSIMQPGIYRSIYNTAVNCGEIGWAEEFIQKYKKDLAGEYREMMFNYCNASLLFAGGKYEDALNKINKINQEFFPLKYDIKTLMLMIYIEIKYYEEARSLILSFKNFLAENKFISANVKTRHLNFINFSNKIINLKEGNKKVIKDLLTSDINAENFIRNKKWLLEKVNE